MVKRSFIENTLVLVKEGATYYKEFFLEKDYLIYSKEFQKQPFYIVVAQGKNYLHLTGLNLKRSYDVSKFVNKMLADKIRMDDILPPSDFKKGSIRDKRAVLAQLQHFWNQPLRAEEDFQQNKITCKLASTNGVCTIGFVEDGTLRPSTLLKGDMTSHGVPVDVILSRPRNARLFDTLEYGDLSAFEKEVIPLLVNQVDWEKLKNEG